MAENLYKTEKAAALLSLFYAIRGFNWFSHKAIKSARTLSIALVLFWRSTNPGECIHVADSWRHAGTAEGRTQNMWCFGDEGCGGCFLERHGRRGGGCQSHSHVTPLHLHGCSHLGFPFITTGRQVRTSDLAFGWTRPKMVDVLFTQLIWSYGRAFLKRRKQEVQREVCKIWRELMSHTKSLNIAAGCH